MFKIQPTTGTSSQSAPRRTSERARADWRGKRKAVRRESGVVRLIGCAGFTRTGDNRMEGAWQIGTRAGAGEAATRHAKRRGNAMPAAMKIVAWIAATLSQFDAPPAQ